MIEPRLASAMRIGALRRRLAAIGGFATIVHRGDPVSGAILILAQPHGGPPRLLEAMPSFDGPPQWQIAWDEEADKTGKKGDLASYLARRRGVDPDLWVIELDVADIAQLDEILLQIG